MGMARLKGRLDRLEQRLWEELYQAYQAWLQQLTPEQRQAFGDRLLDKLAEEGLIQAGSSLQTLQPASEEESDAIIASILELWQEMALGQAETEELRALRE